MVSQNQIGCCTSHSLTGLSPKFPCSPLDATHASQGWANEAVGFFRIIVELESDLNVTAGFRPAHEVVLFGTIFRSIVAA